MIWAVLDTNVLVSGLGWSRGPSAKAVEAAVAGRFILVSSDPLLVELRRALEYPRLVSAFPKPGAIVDLIREIAIVVNPAAALRIVVDEADNRVLEAALEARADAIVTGDRHLLALGREYQGIAVVAARDFLSLLERSVD